MLSALADIFVIIMAIVVIVIYTYVFISVRKIKHDVVELNTGAKNFIQTGHKTYAEMGKAIENLRTYTEEEPAQHMTKAGLMLLATLGAKDLKGFSPEARGQISLARRGAKKMITDGVEAGAPHVIEAAVGGEGMGLPPGLIDKIPEDKQWLVEIGGWLMNKSGSGGGPATKAIAQQGGTGGSGMA